MSLICPLRRLGGRLPYECDRDKCAWWCDWSQSCAIVTLPAEISDRMSELVNSMEGK